MSILGWLGVVVITRTPITEELTPALVTVDHGNGSVRALIFIDGVERELRWAAVSEVDLLEPGYFVGREVAL